MSTFKERLLKEKEELISKIEKLDAFCKSKKFEEIHPVQMSLLTVQLQAMATYGQCLVERILWIEIDEEATAEEAALCVKEEDI